MGWVRLEDTFCEHPKIETLGDLPFRLHVKAICYANRNLTDGYVPDIAARAMGGPKHKRAARALIDAGLWELARGGYRIHDFLDFQPSREAVMARRMTDRVRKDSNRNPSGIQTPRTQPVPKSLKETGTNGEGDQRVLELLQNTKPGRLA
jgi:hypothetical protein